MTCIGSALLIAPAANGMQRGLKARIVSSRSIGWSDDSIHNTFATSANSWSGKKGF